MKRLCLLFIILSTAVPAFAQLPDEQHARLELISDQDAVVPGKAFWVGFHFNVDHDWHMYWINPGDSGLPLKIKWTLPTGVRAGDIQWPYPKRLNLGPLTSFGYDQDVMYLVPLTVDQNISAPSQINLHAKVDWLACNSEMCIPGKAEVNLPLAVAEAPSFNHSQSYFDQVRQDLPQTLPSLSSHVVLQGAQWKLQIDTPLKNSDDITFFPLRDDVIEHAASQPVTETANGYSLNLTKSHLYQGGMQTLEGVAVNPDGWQEDGSVKAIVIQAPVVMPTVQVSFLLACVFALIGGLILNLMPCVLPVLSIKVLHLVERHPDRNIALRHSLMYSLGILCSVWVLAGILFALKSAGQFAGWGFQFQSPVFVIIVAVILFVLALNLFGVFEFSAPAVSGLPKAQAGYQASFISGVVTTIVASPCTAPFMGTALTAAIGQPNLVGFFIFTFLGLGLALPFILLSVFPSLLSFVPKPGMWMIQLKRFLGVVLMACVIWMIWVFGIETGIGDISKFYKPSHQIQWQAFSPSDLMQARQAGKSVFLDFTAAWCINCQVNDRLVLQNPQVVEAFKDKGIVAFKADWTKYDPQITQALATFGRNSIPVYVYYAPGADMPDILPQVITPQIVLDHIKK